MRTYLFLFFMIMSATVFAQSDMRAEYTTAANRAQLYTRLINNSIKKNLQAPLNDSTIELWEDAFNTLELLNYRSSWVDAKIKHAVSYFLKGDLEYQRSLMELLFTNYKNIYNKEVRSFLMDTDNPKVFAMLVEYLLADTSRLVNKIELLKIFYSKFPGDANTDPILVSLRSRINTSGKQLATQQLRPLFNSNFLKGNVILYSIQRKNRDIPGVAIIRDSTGNFTTTTQGKIFSVPHFARSLSSLPYYLTNGNTPQGIFKMYGFGVSQSQFIGPTENIQMCMPVECNMATFLNDSTIRDSLWDIALYKTLIPDALINYQPLVEAYFAGAAGRTEIIAHGTTVDPKYYKGKMYYPHTPSMGCLTTSEIWDDSGRRIASNQQKLVDALTKAGGANGYCVVIEVPGNGPITAAEIQSLVKK